MLLGKDFFQLTQEGWWWWWTTLNQGFFFPSLCIIPTFPPPLPFFPINQTLRLNLLHPLPSLSFSFVTVRYPSHPLSLVLFLVWFSFCPVFVCLVTWFCSYSPCRRLYSLVHIPPGPPSSPKASLNLSTITWFFFLFLTPPPRLPALVPLQLRLSGLSIVVLFYSIFPLHHYPRYLRSLPITQD